MLTCACDDDGDCDWWYGFPKDLQPMRTISWRKCCSCRVLLRPGDEAQEFPRWRNTDPGSIEERIYGDTAEISMASWWLCERCAGLFEALHGLGFCGLLGQDLRKVCREYAEMQRDAGVFRGQMVVARSETHNARADATAAAGTTGDDR